MGARDDEVGSAADRVDRQVRVHPEVGPPGLIDDQWDIVGVGHFGDGGDIGHGTEVAGGDEIDGRTGGMLGQSGFDLGRGDAVRGPESGIDSGMDEVRPQVGVDESVDDRGVDAALADEFATEPADDGGRDVVAARGAVRDEPGTSRAPGLGGELLGLFDRGCAGVIDHPPVLLVDAAEEHREIDVQGLLPHDIGQSRGMGARALMGGNVEALPVLAGQGADRIGIGRRLLTWVDAGGPGDRVAVI